MRMTLFAAAVLLVLSSCSPPVRYSPAEIMQFSPKVQEHIKNSEVALGMPQSAVRYSWGAPDAVRVIEPDDEGRLREEWIYTKFRFYATKLVFTEGKLTGIISGVAKRKPLFDKEGTPTDSSEGIKK